MRSSSFQMRSDFEKKNKQIFWEIIFRKAWWRKFKQKNPKENFLQRERWPCHLVLPNTLPDSISLKWHRIWEPWKCKKFWLLSVGSGPKGNFRKYIGEQSIKKSVSDNHESWIIDLIISPSFIWHMLLSILKLLEILSSLMRKFWRNISQERIREQSI